MVSRTNIKEKSRVKYSRDYHEYVFKNGKFLGKFDDMYKYSSVKPWHQDETAYRIFSDIDILILKQYKFRSVCEIGCGLGYFTKRLSKELVFKSGKGSKVTGIDISEEAIRKASKLFPKIEFIKGNLIEEKPLKDKTFELVIAKEILWYVTHKLDRFLDNATDMVRGGGLFYVSQSFPEKKNWSGQKIINSPEKLKEILMCYAKPVYYCLEYDWNYHGRPFVHFLGRVRK